MPSLLLLTTDLKRGGTPTVVRELSSRLNRLGVAVEVACLDGPGEVGSEISSAGIPVHPMGARGAWDVRALWRLRKLVRAKRYDRVLSLLLHANAAAAIVQPFAWPGTRWFQSVQTTQPNPAWHWQVQRRVAASAERLVVPSRSVADAVVRRCGVKPEQLVVIANGVAPGRPGETVRANSPTGAIGFLGRLDPVKRISDLISAAALLKGVPVRIWGEGAERNRLEQLAEIARRDGGDVRLMGAVTSPSEALDQCAVLVLPSEAEGFGLVLVEAMAAGIPVVASRAPGIVDVVRDGENGLLFEVGDVQGLVAAVKRVQTQADLRERLVRQGQHDVAAFYNWDVIARKYLETLSLETL